MTNQFDEGFIFGMNIGNNAKQYKLDSIDITENGSYAPSHGIDGYNIVNVDVDTNPSIQSITITSNEIYTAEDYGVDGFTPVVIDVVPSIKSKTITRNGTYGAFGCDGYSPVNVNVKSRYEEGYLKGYQDALDEYGDDGIYTGYTFPNGTDPDDFVKLIAGSGDLAISGTESYSYRIYILPALSPGYYNTPRRYHSIFSYPELIKFMGVPTYFGYGNIDCGVFVLRYKNGEPNSFMRTGSGLGWIYDFNFKLNRLYFGTDKRLWANIDFLESGWLGAIVYTYGYDVQLWNTQYMLGDDPYATVVRAKNT